MNQDAEFVEHCLELMEPFNSNIRAKRMFGGYGIFCEALMFALVANGELYFKTDDENEAEFVELDLPKFTYQRGDKQASMGYRRAPESAFQNSRNMTKWVELGWQAAVRTDEAKPPTKRKRTK